MWLFDDILKKPVNQNLPLDPLSGASVAGSAGWQSSSQWSWQGQQDDGSTPIFIQKSSEETVFGAETEALAAAAANAPSISPTVHAETDTSSILMSSPTIMNASDSPVPMIHSAEIISTEMPVMITEAPPQAPIMTPASQAIVESTPSTPIAAPAMILPSTPVMTAEIIVEKSEVPVAPLPVASNSIFDSIMWSDTSPSIASESIATPVISTPEIISTPAVALVSVRQAPADTIVASQEFSTPREFIEKSLANIEVMLTNIDKRHTAKEVEEESYRIEKLRFTELERNALSEKIIMDKERDHTLHMRKILETELVRDAANKNTEPTHVESTLKEIGNEHPIHRHTHKKTEHIGEIQRV
jgi:hypothetical protein